MHRVEAWIAVSFGTFVWLYGIGVMVFAKLVDNVPDPIFWLGVGITALGGIVSWTGRQDLKRMRQA